MSRSSRREKIGEIVEKIDSLGMTYKEGADAFGINVNSIYNYTRNKASEREESLSGGDSGESGELPSDIQTLIADYKRTNPDHGFKRIESFLKYKHMVVVPRKRIREVLRSNGLLLEGDTSFDRVQESEKGTRRFEAEYPRDLYQMDVTYVYIRSLPVLYLVNIVDDYSRFCVGSQLCHDQCGDTLLEVLHNACCRYGKPVRLLTDQGSGFYTWSMERTEFQEYLDDMRIEHIVTDPHSPETQGKIERFHQTIKRELLSKRRFKTYEEADKGIAEYVTYYNYERCHQGIGDNRPADRFHGISGEQRRVERSLMNKKLDLSSGYLIYKFHDHTVSVASSSKGVMIFLDGVLLQPSEVGEKHGDECRTNQET